MLHVSRSLVKCYIFSSSLTPGACAAICSGIMASVTVNTMVQVWTDGINMGTDLHSKTEKLPRLLINVSSSDA